MVQVTPFGVDSKQENKYFKQAHSSVGWRTALRMGTLTGRRLTSRLQFTLHISNAYMHRQSKDKVFVQDSENSKKPAVNYCPRHVHIHVVSRRIHFFFGGACSKICKKSHCLRYWEFVNLSQAIFKILKVAMWL